MVLVSTQTEKHQQRPKLSAEDLVLKIQADNNNQEAWTQLTRQYTPLIRRLILKYPADQQELESAGFGGLMDAVESFDSSLGNKFNTHAGPRIRGAILDRLRELRVENDTRGSRLRYQYLDELHYRLDQLRNKQGHHTEEQTKQTLTEIMEADGAPLEESHQRRKTFDAVLDLHNNPTAAHSIDAPYNRHDPDSVRPDLEDSIPGLDIDLIDGCPLEDCKFPGQDDSIFHIPGITRREMLMLYLAAGINRKQPMTYKKIGQLLGISESRVSQQMSTLAPIIDQHRTGLLTGQILEKEVAVENDPFNRLLIKENITARVKLTRQELNNLKSVRHFLTDEENARIKTIRGGDHEYSIPPLNKDLAKIWSLSEEDTTKTKQELAQKSLLLIRAYVARHSSDTHLNLAIRNIKSIRSKPSSQRTSSIKSFLEGLGYNTTELDYSKTELTSNHKLYDLLTNLNVLNDFTGTTTNNFNSRRNSAMAVAKLLQTEPRNSEAFQLTDKLPSIVESLIQKIMSPALNEAKKLSELGLLTRQGLTNLLLEHENQKLEGAQLTRYVQKHGLELSQNNFWNIANEPKTKERILKDALKRSIQNTLTLRSLCSIIKKHTGRSYKTKAVLTKFAKDNNLKLYYKKYYLGLPSHINQKISKQVRQEATEGRISLERLKEIIQEHAPADFPFDTISDARIKNYAQSKLGINIEKRTTQSRIKPYEDEILKKTKQHVADHDEISLTELNRIVKLVTGKSFKSDQGLLNFADTAGIELTKRSGITQVKAPVKKPKPRQPRVKLSKEHIWDIVDQAHPFSSKGLLNERRLNSIVQKISGQSYPENSTALKKFATDNKLTLRKEEPSTILVDVDNGLSKSIATNELLLDNNIFLSLRERIPAKIDTDSSIKTLTSEPIEGLSLQEKYTIINRLVTADPDSEIGILVRQAINYQRILANLAD